MKVRNKNFGIETSSETVYFKLVCLRWEEGGGGGVHVLVCKQVLVQTFPAA